MMRLPKQSRSATKRKVRRRARVFVGKIPATPTEPQEQA